MKCMTFKSIKKIKYPDHVWAKYVRLVSGIERAIGYSLLNLDLCDATTLSIVHVRFEREIIK